MVEDYRARLFQLCKRLDCADSFEKFAKTVVGNGNEEFVFALLSAGIKDIDHEPNVNFEGVRCGLFLFLAWPDIPISLVMTICNALCCMDFEAADLCSIATKEIIIKALKNLHRVVHCHHSMVLSSIEKKHNYKLSPVTQMTLSGRTWLPSVLSKAMELEYYCSVEFQAILSVMKSVFDHCTLSNASLVSIDHFYMKDPLLFLDHHVASADLERMHHGPQSNSPSDDCSIHWWSIIGDYSFLLTVQQKSLYLHLESSKAMRQEARDAFFRVIFDGPQETMLQIIVRRDHLIEDTMEQLMSLPAFMLRRQLRVQFQGEAGVDQGGLVKEFFQLITAQLLMTDLFQCCPDTGVYWFAYYHSQSDDGDEEELLLQRDKLYRLTGMLMALAIYNSVLFDSVFPPILFRKLLVIVEEYSVHDLGAFDAVLARGLESIANEATNIDNLVFAADVDCIGNVRCCVDLLPDGSKRPVTVADHCEYVQLYCHLLLDRLVHRQFDRFRDGFQAVVGSCPSMPSNERDYAIYNSTMTIGKDLLMAGNAENSEDASILYSFDPVELESVICGSTALNMKEWRRNVRYEGGYTDTTSVIEWFWDWCSIMEQTKPEICRRLLAFVTGSSRAPLGGLSQVPLTIQRSGCESSLSTSSNVENKGIVMKSLPKAHTCFNYLILPEYESRNMLHEHLLFAMDHYQGFGLQ